VQSLTSKSRVTCAISVTLSKVSSRSNSGAICSRGRLRAAQSLNLSHNSLLLIGSSPPRPNQIIDAPRDAAAVVEGHDDLCAPLLGGNRRPCWGAGLRS